MLTIENTPQNRPLDWKLQYFLIISTLFCIYAAMYIVVNSFVMGGTTYYSLFDDAMISMRYAKNLAHGHGLVWNAGGERVEGYTNLLWVLYMAILHLLPLSVSKVCLAVQISAVGILVGNLWFVGKIAATLSNDSRIAVLFSLVLTAFYLPLNTWSLLGMEVSVLTLILTASVWLVQCYLREGQPVLRKLYTLLAIGTLARLDMVVPFGVITLFLLLKDRENRHTHLRTAVPLFLVAVGSQTLFRLAYYGDILPNTYYLKMTGYPLLARLSRGLLVLIDFIGNFNALLVLFPILYVFQKRNDTGANLLLLLVACQMGYSIYVGGDAWEWLKFANRYISIAMPLLLILLSLMLAGLIEPKREEGTPQLSRRQKTCLTYSLLVASLLAVNGVTNADGLRQFFLISLPLSVPDNENMANDAAHLTQITRKEATVATVWAGAPAYYADRRMIDLLGKCDRTIAHQPAHLPFGLALYYEFFPGHTKWDYAYSIGKLQPDVVFQLWKDKEEALPILRRNYIKIQFERGEPMYLRKGSPNVLWADLATMKAYTSDF